jgi:hypothetical protein
MSVLEGALYVGGGSVIGDGWTYPALLLVLALLLLLL